jgi:hypothetical protein
LNTHKTAIQPQFHNVRRSMLKTTIMMIGEYDFDNLFYGADIQYRFVTSILFSIFALCMTILVMNLLIGLAVDDIKGVQEKAALTRLAMTVY